MSANVGPICVTAYNLAVLCLIFKCIESTGTCWPLLALLALASWRDECRECGAKGGVR